MKGKKSKNESCKNNICKNVMLGMSFVVIGMVIGALCCAFGMKNSDETGYLDVYPYLLQKHVNAICQDAVMRDKPHGCTMVGYGISDTDGAPYVEFTYQEVNPNATTMDEVYVGEKYHRTLYFWRDDKRISDLGFYEYSEAYGD